MTCENVHDIHYCIPLYYNIDNIEILPNPSRWFQKSRESKLSSPSQAPLTSTLIGKPWQMVAIDILNAPVSVSGNKYLLVVQDCFTKWADAIPLKAITITKALVNLFATMGMPQIVHSDQGQNFESMVLKNTLDAFRI